jgi:hypothetical protein
MAERKNPGIAAAVVSGRISHFGSKGRYPETENYRF